MYLLIVPERSNRRILVDKAFNEWKRYANDDIASVVLVPEVCSSGYIYHHQDAECDVLQQFGYAYRYTTQTQRQSVPKPLSVSVLSRVSSGDSTALMDCIRMLSVVASHGLVYHAADAVLEWQQEVRRQFVKDRYISIVMI